VALAACSAGASAAEPGSGERPSASISSHDVEGTPGQITDYWTARRMRRADPISIEMRRSGQARRLSGTSQGSIKQPRSHIPFTLTEIANPEAEVNRTNGRVFFHDPVDGNNYRCSGTAIDAANRSLVLTAGHCTFYGEFMTNWMFVPGYHDHVEPYGRWAATQLSAPSGWTGSFDCPGVPDDCPNFNYDMGMAMTAVDGGGQGVEDVVGARGIAFNQPRNPAPQSYVASGYPVVPNPPFDGESLWTCDSPYGGDDAPDSRGGPAPMFIGCSMGGGSSGGGWVVGNAVQGLNSYGYDSDLEADHLYGPYFGIAAKCLYGDTSGQPPPPVDTVLLKHPKRKTRKRSAKFRFAASGPDLDCVQGFQCTLGKLLQGCASGEITYKKLKRRKRYTFEAAALDAAGNPDGTPATYKFKVKRKHH
jgi:hypothetical protein